MQKILGFFIGILLLTLLISCNQATKQPQLIITESGKPAQLQIIYFHPTIRCATCNAVENNTIKLLKENFTSAIENGTIEFFSYNLEEDANKALVEKYQISFSTLLLVRTDSLTDFTDKAFKYALVKPVKFAELLKAEINTNLN